MKSFNTSKFLRFLKTSAIVVAALLPVGVLVFLVYLVADAFWDLVL